FQLAHAHRTLYPFPTRRSSDLNSHSGDPHFEPRADRSERLKEGDFVLLDIWAKTMAPGACYYDITWTGFIGQSPGEHQREIFEIDRKSTRLNSSHGSISYAVFC